MRNKRYFRKEEWDFAKLVVGGMIFLTILPLLISSKAIGPLCILLAYYGIVQLDKFLKFYYPPQMNVILQKVDGKFVAYNYHSLERIGNESYYSIDLARNELSKKYPNIKFS